MRNIICSSTRGWNCGDDFILFGIKNLLRQKYAGANFVVQNRHPSWINSYITLNRDVTLKHEESIFTMNPWKSLQVGRFFKADNSWRSELALDQFDMVVFAGSPEWQDLPVRQLVTSLVETDIPVLYLGIGSFELIANSSFEDIGELDRRALQKARLVTVRDRILEQILAPIGAQLLPCPALFSTKHEKTFFSKSPRLSFCLQFASSRQSISQDVEEFSINLLQELSTQYEVEIVCHYIDELKLAEERFGTTHEIRYSYDPRDYEHIYAQYDLNVTTRVHGAGLCASLAIPSFVLSHSQRSDTVDGFLAEKIHPETESVAEVVSRIVNFDIAGRSAELRQHKYEAMAQYRAALNAAL